MELFSCGSREFLEFLFSKINPVNEKIIIVHVNLNNYFFFNTDKNLLNDVCSHSVPVFEGIGLKTAVALKGLGILKDLNGTDLMPEFLKLLGNTGFRIFLLGGSEDVISQTEKFINSDFPEVIISGKHNGYFNGREEEIVKLINDSNTDILLISMGTPVQEKFSFRFRTELKVRLIWNLGGLFDIISGKKKRAPLFIRKARLEWLYRFKKEPIRMLRRNTAIALWSFKHILANARK